MGCGIHPAPHDILTVMCGDVHVKQKPLQFGECDGEKEISRPQDKQA